MNPSSRDKQTLSRLSSKKKKHSSATSANQTLIKKSDDKPVSKGSKALRRFTSTKTKLFFFAIMVATTIFQIINIVLEEVAKHYEGLTKNVRENDLKNFEKVLSSWRDLQHSHCIFFKFVRFHSKTNSIITNMQLISITSQTKDSCKEDNSCDYEFKKKIRNRLELIKNLQDDIDKYLDSKVTDVCSLNGVSLTDEFYNLSETKRRGLMDKLKIQIQESVKEAGGAMVELTTAATIEDPNDKGTVGEVDENVGRTKTLFDSIHKAADEYVESKTAKHLDEKAAHFFSNSETREISSELANTKSKFSQESVDYDVKSEKLKVNDRDLRKARGRVDTAGKVGSGINLFSNLMKVGSAAYSIKKEDPTIGIIRTTFQSIKTLIDIFLLVPKWAKFLVLMMITQISSKK